MSLLAKEKIQQMPWTKKIFMSKYQYHLLLDQLWKEHNCGPINARKDFLAMVGENRPGQLTETQLNVVKRMVG
jgi:hypothetical protein